MSGIANKQGWPVHSTERLPHRKAKMERRDIEDSMHSCI